ncbi:MAG TPA: hypothetical protein VGL56_10655 [Fimbriimonadaceae bacterium]|jgi:prephenate dehydrogenase
MEAPLVVGYKGEIGRFILAGLLEDMPKANDIFCVDINNSEDEVRERIRKSDYIFLCVPLQHTVAWIDGFLPDLSGKILVEQCSVKSFLYENESYKTLNLLSMHLLFRPSATPIKDRRCLVFSERGSSADLAAFSDLMARALKTSVVSIDSGAESAHLQHDRLMAYQQSLVHRVILVLASKIQDEHGQTFVGQRIQELAERIEAGDPELYRLIQGNPFTDSVVADFESSLRGFKI